VGGRFSGSGEDMSDTQEEMDIVSAMLRRAREYGLEVEVVTFFGSARASGDSVADAASYALYEWDL
jgi:hypothetical protein